MASAIVSPDFEIVIPKEIREAMNIKPGEKVQVFKCDGRIVIVPVMSIDEAYGFLKGIDTDIPKEPDRI